MSSPDEKVPILNSQGPHWFLCGKVSMRLQFPRYEDYWTSRHSYINVTFQSESSNESLGTIPITPRVDESIPNLGARPVHWPLKIHGSSVYSLSFVVRDDRIAHQNMPHRSTWTLRMWRHSSSV